MQSTVTPIVTNPCPCCFEEGHQVQLLRIDTDAEGYSVPPFYYCERCGYSIDDNPEPPEVDERE